MSPRKSPESTISSFQRLLYGLLDIEVEGTPQEIELLFWDASFAMEPTPGITKVLTQLKDQGIRLAVLSNMTFGGAVIAHELRKHGLSGYFDFVASSSDYGFRKPAKVLFEVVLRKAKCQPDQAWYVGDSFEADVMGASGAGLHPVWYNPARIVTESPVRHLEIHEWSELVSAVNQRIA